MLTLRQMGLLARFFEGFDSHLLQVMEHDWVPGEPEITRRLWSMLARNEAWNIKGVESNPFDWLETELASDGFEIDFEIKMQGHGSLEADISFADFGLVVIFEDAIESTQKSAAYIVQAKKLYRKNKKTHVYSANDKFSASDEQQRIGLWALGTVLSPSSVKYMAYCPTMRLYDAGSQRAIRSLQTPNIGSLYSGNQFGLALSMHLNSGGSARNAGGWIAPIRPRLHTAATLHKEAFHTNLPFGWFIIANLFFLSSERSYFYSGLLREWEFLENSFGIDDNDDPYIRDLTLRFALCDNDAIEEVAEKVAQAAPDAFFPPQASLTIRVRRSPQLELDLTLIEDPAPPSPGIGRRVK